MQGSGAVIAALNDVLAHTWALHQQAHFQEHAFEVRNWSFSGWFDKVETQSHEKLTHYLMNRIGALGGKPVFKLAWQPTADESIGAALRSLLVGMQKTRDAYGRACEAAEADDDYVTEKMIWGHLKRLEHWMVKFEARIAQLDKVGEVAFLAEYL